MKNILSIILSIIFIILIIIFIHGSTQFLYPFLSNTYTLHLCCILLLLLILFQKQPKINCKIFYSHSLLIIFLWVLYIITNNLYSNKGEQYYITYLIISLSILLSIFHLISSGRITSKVIYIIIFIFGIIESFTVLFQFLQILPSNSSIYKITGSGINPNISAMIICISLPAGVELLISPFRKFWYWITPLFLIIIISLFATQCRTSFLSLFLVSFLYIQHSLKFISKRKFKLLLIVIPTFFILMFSVLNFHKNGSSNGRLLIWKISSEMIVKKPITGYGYGLFEKSYNLEQASYFNNKIRPDTEIMSATHTAMAYNEFLGQFVMGGLFGGLLFVSVAISLIWAGWKDRKDHFTPLAGIIIFLLMSTFNFTIECPSIFLLFLLYTSLILKNSSKVFEPPLPTFNFIKYGVILSSIIFSVWSIQKYFAQKQLTKVSELLANGQASSAGVMLTKLESDISTSEAFYRQKANYFMAKNDYQNARLAILEALELTSDPAIMQDLAMITYKIGNINEATYFLHIACGIEPHQFRPRMILMNIYLQSGQKENAKAISKEIINLKPKIISPKVDKYKQIAKTVYRSIQREDLNISKY